MKKTENFALNQWEPTDALRRSDFNADNAVIDAALTNKAENSAVSAVETALANYKTANEVALAKKAETSVLTAYKTSNDAAVAAAVAKANAAYSASNPSTEFIQVDTTEMVEGDTIYTFSKAPRFVLLSGIWTTSVVGAGETVTFLDFYIQNSSYTVSFRLSGAVLTLVSRGNVDAAKTLRIIAFY